MTTKYLSYTQTRPAEEHTITPVYTNVARDGTKAMPGWGAAMCYGEVTAAPRCSDNVTPQNRRDVWQTRWRWEGKGHSTWR